MLFVRAINTVSASLLCAGLIVAVPTPARATDIDWRSQSILEPTVAGFDFTRHGVATFKTGELAIAVLNGNFGPIDSEGRQSFNAQANYRFDDNSTISTAYHGSWDLTTGAQRGAGEIVAGTGRFHGITGTMSFTGQLHARVAGNSPRFPGPAEADWTGSYSLPTQ